MTWLDPAHRGAALIILAALAFAAGWMAMVLPRRATGPAGRVLRWGVGPALAFLVAPVTGVFGLMQVSVDWPVSSANP